jgi:hypothetical protein
LPVIKAPVDGLSNNLFGLSGRNFPLFGQLVQRQPPVSDSQGDAHRIRFSRGIEIQLNEGTKRASRIDNQEETRQNIAGSTNN